MKTNLLLLFLFLSCIGWAQPYLVGHTTITFNDPSRSGGFGSGGGAGRQIQSEIYYPATVAGNDVTISNGQFPYIVFGHGFVMAWDAYQNIIDHYVPLGYVLVFPRTEGGLSPTHQEFAMDLLLVGTKMEALSTNSSSSFYYNAWNGKKAVMGHSMGGGSSFLAASQNTANFDILVGLAPAETNPSAINVSSSIQIPTIVFSGSEDAVTPPATNHLLMYDSVANVCKDFISITGGGHCYFANASTTCDFGEATSGGNLTISRTEQHDITFAILDPYLKFYLMKDCPSWTDFTNQRDTDIRIQAQNSCNYSLPLNPTIVQSGSTLSITSNLTISWYLNNTLIANEQSQSIDSQIYGDGTYEVHVTDQNGCYGTAQIIVGNGTTGILESEITNYSIYPNPTKDIITIQVNNSDIQLFELIDLEGRIIELVEFQSSTTMDLQQLKSGTYFLRHKDHPFSKRIIKY